MSVRWPAAGGRAVARWARRRDPVEPQLGPARLVAFRLHTERAGTGTDTDPALWPEAWRAAVLPQLAERFGVELATQVIGERLASGENAAQHRVDPATEGPSLEVQGITPAGWL